MSKLTWCVPFVGAQALSRARYASCPVNLPSRGVVPARLGPGAGGSRHERRPCRQRPARPADPRHRAARRRRPAGTSRRTCSRWSRPPTCCAGSRSSPAELGLDRRRARRPDAGRPGRPARARAASTSCSAGIAWPAEVLGTALAVERLMVPPAAEQEHAAGRGRGAAVAGRAPGAPGGAARRRRAARRLARRPRCGCGRTTTRPSVLTGPRPGARAWPTPWPRRSPTDGQAV